MIDWEGYQRSIGWENSIRSTRWEEYQRLKKQENQAWVEYVSACDEYSSLGFLQIFSYKKRKKIDELRKARREIFELTNAARDKWWELIERMLAN